MTKLGNGMQEGSEKDNFQFNAADPDNDKKQRRRDAAKQFLRGQTNAFEALQTKLEPLPSVVEELKNVLSTMHENQSVPARAPVVYTKIPEVEVRVIVHRIESVEPAEMRFKADFSVHLAWCDPNFAADGAHPSEADWASKDLFNPQLVILNAESPPFPLGDGHLEPPVCTQVGAGNQGAWLRKAARFRAVLVLEEANLGYFPFDLHELPIKLDVTIPRAVRVEAGVVPRIILKQPTQSGLGQVDVWHSPPDREMTMTMDFAVVGMNYDAGADDAGSYSLRFLVKRVAGIRGSEMLIINVLPFLAMGTLWESSGLLANRLVITLLVMIALVVVSGRRPQELNKAPCWTVYDRCCHEALFIVAIVALQNIMSSVFYQRCGDSDEGICKCQSSCGRAWCGARSLDCYTFPILVALHCFLGFFPFLWAHGASIDLIGGIFKGTATLNKTNKRSGKGVTSIVPVG
eukprot:gnl/MRDRNA2_/MRDRNA2_107565_c0_seq1.p1 gnl/MRDRNA2_/MRDRNA2_107565_c0~~gnl/MRDRNA2_/MRDRNA2_107565_c0_seq1.p1  ORF type:complete len:461 (-),score=77.62 gnl/MRDRNA2_/MRDRNA2_107565_c0_seq1:87-1469(-)